MKSRGFKKPPIERKHAPLIGMTGKVLGVHAPALDVVTGAAPKGIVAKSGKQAPLKDEVEWMDAIVRYGCIACRLDGLLPRPTAVHHILRGGVRLGHLYTLPLCDPGHHQNGRQFGFVSRHPWKARFEAKYGSEMSLWGAVGRAIYGLGWLPPA